MAVDIGPRIGIDGEEEFRKELRNISQRLKTLGSEMKSVTSAFQTGDDAEQQLAEQTAVLTKQIEAQERKVTLLKKGLSAAAEKFGENATETLKWQQAVHDANTDLNRMQQQLQPVENAVEDLDDAMERSGKSFGDFRGAFVKGLSVAAVVGGIKEVAGSILDLEEQTREYRSLMGQLAVSSEDAGYSAEQTEQIFMRLYGVMGDTQAAVEATSQLQTMKLSQDDLLEATNAVIGGWTRLGGAAPIETLAESVSQTIAAGKATGAFSDLLMAANVNEDEFNKKLEAANDTTERAQIVLDELARQGLADAGEAYIELNQDIVKANESQAKLDEAWGDLGETLTPVANLLRNTLAGALGFVTQKLDDATDSVKDLKSWWDRTKESISALKSGGASGVVDALTSTPGLGSTGRTTSRLTGAGGDSSAYWSSIHTTVELDGKVVGESVTQQQSRNERAGGR